jgi:type IV secretion system protein VirB6
MSGIFVGMSNAMNTGIDQVLQGQMSLFSSMMIGLVSSSITLYVCWFGYQTIAGKLQTPFSDVVWNLARMAIILAFVSNSGGYLDNVIAAINGLKEGFSGGESIWAILDTLWMKAQTIGQELYNHDDSTYVKLSGAFAQFLVWLGTVLTLSITTVVTLGAELVLKLMCVTAPIFIFCLLYGFLLPMFNNWLRIIFSSILTIVFASLTLRVSITYLSQILDKATTGVDTGNIVTIGAQCLLAGMASAFVVWLAAKIAGALAGAGAQAAVQGAAAVGALSAGFAAKRAAGSIAGKLGDTGSNTKNAATELSNGFKTDHDRQKAVSKAAVEKMKSLNK